LARTELTGLSRTRDTSGIVENLPRVDREYEAYAFLDNDITVSAAQLDTLFRTGLALGLDLFQAALTTDSITPPTTTSSHAQDASRAQRARWRS